MSDMLIRPVNPLITKAEIKQQLVRQVELQRGAAGPRAIVFCGTHEPLERTLQTVPALRSRFGDRGIVFVESPIEHRPAEFFAGVFDLLRARVAQMATDLPPDLPLRLDQRLAITAQFPQLLKAMQSVSDQCLKKFASLWQNGGVKNSAWDLSFIVEPLVYENFPAHGLLNGDRRELFGLPQYLTERFFADLLAEQYPGVPFYSLHLSPKMPTPKMLIGTAKVREAGLALPDDWSFQDMAFPTGPKVNFDMIRFQKSVFYGVIEVEAPMGDLDYEVNDFMKALMGSYFFFAGVRGETIAYFRASSPTESEQILQGFTEGIELLETANP